MTWIAFGAAAVSVPTAVVAHIVREGAVTAYNDDGRYFYGTQSRDDRCGSDRRRAETAQVIAIAGYAAGTAALIAGATLLFSQDSQPEEQPPVAASIGLGSALLQYQASF